ncbi:MAG TPA: rhomboid family intramembrane serine protease [Candidatus Saccharimonadales bacterium]|nr:rhomboid family intramembrane serine protease [Candidatus Saccharimonadales bacterium]
MIPLRDENPTRRFPVVTVALIAVNCLAFLYELALPPATRADLVMVRGLVPALVWNLPALGPAFAVPVGASVFTSMFLHGDILHLLGNMLFLWVFGDNVEDRMGRGRFIVFYLVCGMAAAATQVAAMPGSRVPMIGASGAISGVLGAYMLLFPRARVLTLVPIFIFIQFMRLPAVFVLGIWFLYQVLLSFAAGSGGGVAWFAHIGGFIAGVVLLAAFLPRRPPPVRVARGPGWI